MGIMTMLMLLKAFGLISFIFTVLLLTVSFFVLFVARKTEMQGLKVFGYVIAVLLWVCAAVVFLAVISLSLAGRGLHMPMMRQMQSQKPPMMQGQAPGMMQEGPMKMESQGGEPGKWLQKNPKK